jgi:hypothetical protein
MTITPFQNLIINFLSEALSVGGYEASELYFEQLTPLVILSETAAETGQTVDQVQDDINEQAENPAEIEDNPSAVDENIETETLSDYSRSNPNFKKNFETYKNN